MELARHLADTAEPGEVLVTSTVTDVVVGSGLEFTSVGTRQLAPGGRLWALHRLTRDAPGPLVASGYETDVRYISQTPSSGSAT